MGKLKVSITIIVSCSVFVLLMLVIILILDGSDIIFPVGSLQYPPGSTTAAITVPIIDDGVAELTETFTVQLMSNDAILMTDSITVTIIDNDGKVYNITLYLVWSIFTGIPILQL